MHEPDPHCCPITVSVVLPTYNRARYLPEALDSLLGQSRVPDEIIVVDDGSTDGTAEAVARYGARLRYVRQPENRGKPAAVNRGIPLARGSHIWIFDDDDVALPDALQSHVEFLTAHPDIDFSYSSNYVFAGNGNIWQREKWHPKHLPFWPTEEFFIQHALHMHAMMQGMLIPKRCFDAIGGFDSALLRSQDDEMVLRLAYHFKASDIRKRTFVLREHAGERGASAARHTAAQRDAIWLQYGRRIYREAYCRYPLSACLPHLPGTEVALSGDAERRRALLWRGAIMLHHGLEAEALLDLQAALRTVDATTFDACLPAAFLSAAFDVDSWRLAHPYVFAFKLRRYLKNVHVPGVMRAIRRGVYWSLDRSLRQRRWRDALRSTGMLAFLMLPGTLARPRR